MPCSIYIPDENVRCCIGNLATVGKNGVNRLFVPKYNKELYEKINASIAAVKKVNEALPEI